MTGERGQSRERPVLEVRGLDVMSGRRRLLGPFDLSISAGRVVALVGESGAGKTLASRAMLGMLPRGLHARADGLEIDGRDVRRLGARRWRRLRGARVGLVSQDALVALDPLRRLGDEITEAARIHDCSLRGAALRSRLADALVGVGLDRVPGVERARPHEVSGGQRQRAHIAQAAINRPGLLIADEPTTALDSVLQRQIIELLRAQRHDGAAILLISHDLGLVSELADEIVVLREGAVVERGPTASLLAHPSERYTRELIDAVPGRRARERHRAVEHEPEPVEADGAPARPHPVLEFDTVSRRYRGARILAASDVSFSLERGEILGLVGASGSGKSTLARLALGIETPDSGLVTAFGMRWSSQRERERRPHRRRIQLVHQDPASALDPRWSARRSIAEALEPGLGSEASRARVDQLLMGVGLPTELAARTPGRLSGGQKQRVAIARALAAGAEILVCDEVVSALDVSVQAQILELLEGIRRRRGTSILFITHDLAVVAQLCDRVLVLDSGRIVERGAVTRVLDAPEHPVTRELVEASTSLAFASRSADAERR